ncbi:MAG TPA: FtsW/RodA/SpoVE family cell cycle protein [Chloroflexia bacterium]|nr:FtsW/RodA/SpoVE family cell cycle protein [Chloroflexia bacterium]
MNALKRAFAAIRRWRWTEFQLLIVPAILSLVGMLIVIVVPTGNLSFTWRDLWMSLLFVGLLVATHLVLGAMSRGADQILLPAVAIITALGLIMIQRLQLSLVRTLGEGYEGIAAKQMLWITLGFAILVATLFVSRDLVWLRRYKYTWALLGTALVAATLVFGQDPNGSGVRLWFKFGPLSFQPSELLKVVLVVFLAGYLYDIRDLLSLNTRIGPISLPPLPYLLPMVSVWGLAMVLFIVQKDLGSALLFFGIFLAMLFVATGKPLYVVGGIVAFAAGAFAMYELFDVVRLRAGIWLSPWSYATGPGYQYVQALYAYATGGALGTGFGYGSPGWVPAVHTDFVFAAIAEELGLAGTLATVCFYLLLVFRGYHIALRARDHFHQMLAVGLSTILGLQTLIILGGATGMIPLTGITLPFISYGGSSLLTNFIIIGLLLRISALTAAVEERRPALAVQAPAATLQPRPGSLPSR